MADDAERLRTIPLFPLPTVSLFPAVRAPFFIFEPRYRQLTADALAGEKVIGMVTVVPAGREAMAGDPEVYPIGCLGWIDSAKQRPDGTWDIALEGVSRFAIEEELSKPEGRLYREARVRMLEDEPDSRDAVDRLRAEVHRSYGAVLAQLAPQYVDAYNAQNFEVIPDDVYANTVSLSLDIDPVEKQSLLDSPSISARLERVLAVLEFQLAASGAGSSGDSKTLQ